MGKPALKEGVRDALLDAADGLFRRYGYKKTTVEDIADAASMSRGTVYLYFRSKEEIALAWSNRFSERRCEAMRAAFHSGGTVSGRLHRMLGARVLTTFDLAQHYTESLDDLVAALRPALLERRLQSHETEAAILGELLDEGRSQGLFVFSDKLETARLLVLVTNPLMPYSLSPSQLGARAEIEERVNALVQMLLHGLHPRPDPEPRPAALGEGLDP